MPTRPDSAVLDAFHDDYLVGLLAARRGIVSQVQLEEAVQIRLRSRPLPRLLPVLQALAGVSESAMFPVYDAFYSLLLGSIAVRRGLVTDEQLIDALEAQSGQDPKPLLGTVLVGLGLVAPDALARLLREQESAWTEALAPAPAAGTRGEPPSLPRSRLRARAGVPAGSRRPRML